MLRRFHDFQAGPGFATFSFLVERSGNSLFNELINIKQIACQVVEIWKITLGKNPKTISNADSERLCCVPSPRVEMGFNTIWMETATGKDVKIPFMCEKNTHMVCEKYSNWGRVFKKKMGFLAIHEDFRKV